MPGIFTSPPVRNISMVMRVRAKLVEEGLDAVLTRKKRETPPIAPIFDGVAQAQLIALPAPNRRPATHAGPSISWRTRWWRPKKTAQAAPEAMLDDPAQG